MCTPVVQGIGKSVNHIIPMVVTQQGKIQSSSIDGVPSLAANVEKEPFEKPCPNLGWVKKDSGNLGVVTGCENAQRPVLLSQVDRKVAQSEQAILWGDFVIPGVKREGPIGAEFSKVPEGDDDPNRNQRNEWPFINCEGDRIVIGRVDVRVEEFVYSVQKQ